MHNIHRLMHWSRLCSRYLSSQKEVKKKPYRNSNANYQRYTKKGNSDVRTITSLWKPFREVLTDDEADKESTPAEVCSEFEGCGPAARFWRVPLAEAHERAADAVTPLWRLDYHRQLQVKQARVRALLHQLRRTLADQGTALGRHSLPCPLDQIVPSPQIDGYRNKEEYKIGEGVDGDPKTVGFIFSSPTRGPPLCLPGDRLRNVKPQHARVAREFQSFLQTSPVGASCRLDEGGSWRLLLVRSNSCDQLQVSVTFHPQQLAAEVVSEERERLRQYFQTGPGARCDIQSLFFQECRHARCSADQAPYQLLFGPATLQERLGDLTVLLSPGSFAQVNWTAAAELYRVVARQARLTPASVLLDLCCGTGPISLLMARHCRTCIGIEAAPGAVDDANRNARINGIENVEFVAGRVEKELPQLTDELELCSDMVAVVNPGRDGVAPRLVELLRDTTALRRVIYIACKPEHARTAANLAALCRPDGGFRLTRASPVDLFPSTDHVELVLTYER